LSAGVDKLELLTRRIEKPFLNLAREEGFQRSGYKNVIDLRQTRYKLPVILHCDGWHGGIHKIQLIGVARLGLRRARRLLGTILGDLSFVRIYRIDLCTDIPGIYVGDLAETVLVSRVQNFRIYKKRGGLSFYLQNSANKTILIYDKLKQLAATKNPRATAYGPGERLTRIEVQLKGSAVPFKKLRHLRRYADVDLLENLEFRTLKNMTSGEKPLHRLASAGLRQSISQIGLQATKKKFASSEWAYLERLFLEEMGNSEEVLDIRSRLKRSIEDWLENRIRFPRYRNVNASDGRD